MLLRGAAKDGRVNDTIFKRKSLGEEIEGKSEIEECSRLSLLISILAMLNNRKENSWTKY
jgi:hypothetical protein